MTTSSLSGNACGARTGRPPLAARTLLGLLERLAVGRLALTLPNGESRGFGSTGPLAHLTVTDWRMFAVTLKRGDIGFAESFLAGHWSTPSLVDLLELLVLNRHALEASVYGGRLGRFVNRFRHWLNRNSRAGSRRNIVAHYDLGNAFYRLWLDPGMTYSGALFEGREARSIAAAQDAKYRRILQTLALPAGARVLEIGCGWGGFAERAIEHGLSLTGLTLSDEQLRFARERLSAERLSAENSQGRARFLLEDYRAHPRQAPYDGVVSIEMFEAVGERYWPAFFDTVRRQLKPAGRAVIQTITIADALFERYRKGSDFIQQYIFPGGMLASPTEFELQARRAGLIVVDKFAFGQDYARTLAHWHASYVERLADVRALGFDDRFIRLWTFYLAYCEAAFRQRNIDVMHFTLQRSPSGATA